MLPRALPRSPGWRLRRNQRTSMGAPVLWTRSWAAVRMMEGRPSQPTTSVAWSWEGTLGVLALTAMARLLESIREVASCSMRRWKVGSLAAWVAEVEEVPLGHESDEFCGGRK